MHRILWLLLLVLFPPVLVPAQERVASAIQPYTSCHFHDGLQIVQTDALPATPMVRTIQTPEGDKQITMLEGERIMFAYPSEDFYANVKAEQLERKDYAREKADLIAQLQTMANDGTSRIEPELPSLQGLELHELNRLALEGGVLGVYLLFDDKEAVVTTIYFLNQEPAKRHFQSLPEYGRVRDHFLASYVSCIRTNQRARAKP